MVLPNTTSSTSHAFPRPSPHDQRQPAEHHCRHENKTPSSLSCARRLPWTPFPNLIASPFNNRTDGYPIKCLFVYERPTLLGEVASLKTLIPAKWHHLLPSENSKKCKFTSVPIMLTPSYFATPPLTNLTNRIHAVNPQSQKKSHQYHTGNTPMNSLPRPHTQLQQGIFFRTNSYPPKLRTPLLNQLKKT